MEKSVYEQSAPEQLATELQAIVASLGSNSATIQAYFQLRIFSGLLSRVSQADIESSNILPAYFGVLYALKDGKSLSPTELRRYVFTGLSNLTTLIDRMERDGLVQRERDHEDRRRVCVHLTEKGKLAWKDTAPAHYDWVESTMSVLSEQELGELTRLLGVVWTGLLAQAREKGIHFAGIPSPDEEDEESTP
ncbi:MarR family winged helix-turn-helix transcriptional regulator [Chloroflexota bacterium]